MIRRPLVRKYLSRGGSYSVWTIDGYVLKIPVEWPPTEKDVLNMKKTVKIAFYNQDLVPRTWILHDPDTASIVRARLRAGWEGTKPLVDDRWYFGLVQRHVIGRAPTTYETMELRGAFLSRGIRPVDLAATSERNAIVDQFGRAYAVDVEYYQFVVGAPPFPDMMALTIDQAEEALGIDLDVVEESLDESYTASPALALKEGM